MISALIMNDSKHVNGVTIDEMQHSLGFHPYPFQLTIISHIIKISNRPSSSHHIQACLLVQHTSGGQSSVYQMIGVTKCGVTLTTESMLSLSHDRL